MKNFPVCEDYELWLRISSRWKIGFSQDPLVIKYGGHEDQLSIKYKAMDYFRVMALLPFLESQNIKNNESISTIDFLCGLYIVIVKNKSGNIIDRKRLVVVK